MRLRSALIASVVVAFLGVAAIASEGPTVVAPGHEQWKAQPGNYQMAVLYGDPSKAEFYVVRLKVPANWTFPAHTHPMRENLTVISGTFYAGIGTKMDKTKVAAYPAGSFISLPAKLPHYALTKDTGAVIQLEGTGPLEENMIK
jgi:quercetin dioxygenase-like cupin family protein